MLRILLAAAVLLVAAYFYLSQDGKVDGDIARPLQAQQRALEQAKQVEKTVQEQAEALKKQIDAQTGGTDDDDGDEH